MAAVIDGHPRIDYKPEDIEDADLSSQALVEKMWHQMSGSSVWLPELQVYLLVTRVLFGENIFWPTISFLRGRVFDEDWEELHDYTITWDTKSYTFPLVFDIAIPYTLDGMFFGTEDPRVIMEDGVEHAEPVVVFNMVGPISDWKRAMYIFRPFSNKLTLLTIEKLGQPDTEKNWAPFFVPQYSLLDPSKRESNEYIHFIYNHKPLRILRCHLRCGDCEFLFDAEIPANLFNVRKEDGGDLRGGSNFVPVPLQLPPQMRQRIDIWIALPRTHIETDCGAMYRPELIVMIRTDAHFYMSFASKSLDFGSAIVDHGPDENSCPKGRIMIPMSLVRWDTQPHRIEMVTYSPEGDSATTYPTSDPGHTDILTATFSVDDTHVQVARIVGLLSLVKGIPQVKALLSVSPSSMAEDRQSAEMRNMLSSWVSDDIRGCLVEAAINYTAPYRKSPDGADPTRPDDSKKLLLKEFEEKHQAKLLAEGKLGPERLSLDQLKQEEQEEMLMKGIMTLPEGYGDANAAEAAINAHSKIDGGVTEELRERE